MIKPRQKTLEENLEVVEQWQTQGCCPRCGNHRWSAQLVAGTAVSGMAWKLRCGECKHQAIKPLQK